MKIYKEKLEELNFQANQMFNKMNKINSLVLQTTINVEMSVVDSEKKFQEEIDGLLEGSFEPNQDEDGIQKIVRKKTTKI